MTKYAASNTYTDQELLDLYREAIARVSVSGQSYSVGSRTFTAADLGELRAQVDWLEKRVNAESGAGMAHNLARVRRAR